MFNNHLMQWHTRMNRMRAEKMIAIGNVAKEMLQERLNTPYPPASIPGQYPRRRTGNLMRSVQIFPRTAATLVKNFARKPMAVVLGYAKQGFYGYILTWWGRKGPQDVAALRELQTRAQTIMNAKQT
jgi:hypothetical protein